MDALLKQAEKQWKYNIVKNKSIESKYMAAFLFHRLASIFYT